MASDRARGTRTGFGLLSVCLALAACADAGPPRAEDPRGWRGAEGSGPQSGPPQGLNLFVSPSGEPFRAGPGEPYPVARWFDQADANHDGAVGLDEFRADAARFFTTLDLNGDGVLSDLEIVYYERVVLPEMLGRGRRFDGAPGPRERREGSAAGAAPPLGLAQGFPGEGGPGGGGGGRGRGRGGRGAPPGSGGQAAGPETEALGAAPYGLLAEPEPVSGSDLNFDGRVTRAEFLTRAAQRFHALDAEGAGALRLADLPKTAAQRALERGAGGRGRDRPPGG